MGKKNKKKDLGRALIRDRFGANRNKKDDHSYLHSIDMQDGYNWGNLNLRSVTEENSFQEFLATAELAGTDFQAEKLNIKFVNLKSSSNLLSKEKQEEIINLQKKNQVFLKIPRRPKWNSLITTHELQMKEKQEFLEWRKKLATLQETEGLILTPYEKNLEFWRELWRVIERSDIVVQIVDARNPLLFRCEDLEQYVKEINPNKINMILINKADFLTKKQRITWANYFSRRKIYVAFFSTILTAEENKVVLKNTLKDGHVSDGESNSESTHTLNFMNTSKDNIINDDFKNMKIKEKINNDMSDNSKNLECTDVNNSADILTREELILLFKKICPRTDEKSVITIGLVGYPNVGKSSTINALLMSKKVSVSATPGKTKHFQTLYLDKHILLCDCPGLVMPSFVNVKAEMLLYGILPIHQMKDHISPINLLGTLIPRHILENVYGIMIPIPREGEDPDRSPTAEEILNVHAFNRGFMTQNGQPDNSRSARYILKDFVTGKLLYCKAPPECRQAEFHIFPMSMKKIPTNNNKPQQILKAISTTTEDLDQTFFQSNHTKLHVQGKHMITTQIKSDGAETIPTINLNSSEKPWKKINKHCNKKKREKARRIYAHLDQH